ncbi:hypothetical protein FA13DRAFT_1800877 [Coprinellus micaceus]|uniref:Uncharacterized protein n=1 Tax=Coprinellus micaceus TaxID=71717 RepID=A0A4Y7SF93_COPMI|nr:hypothetical protein FA13DRAFT_1800877 [Coprinellus micaceus]
MGDVQPVLKAAYPPMPNDNILGPVAHRSLQPIPNVFELSQATTLSVDDGSLNGIYDTTTIGEPSPFAPHDDSLPPSGSIMSALVRFFNLDMPTNNSDATGTSSNGFDSDIHCDLIPATFDSNSDSSFKFVPPIPTGSSSTLQQPDADTGSNFDSISSFDFVPEGNQYEMNMDISFPSLSNDAYTFGDQTAYSISHIPFPDFHDLAWVYIASDFEHTLNDSSHRGLLVQA